MSAGPGAPAGSRRDRPSGADIYWRLSDTVTASIAAGRVLFLDVGRDRYFALPPTANAAFAAWLEGDRGEKPPRDCRDMLIGTGIAGPERAGQVRALPQEVAMPAPLDADLLAQARVGTRILLGVGRAVVQAWRDVRSRPLAAILARRLPPRIAGGSPTGRGRGACLAQFRAARPLVPVARACLHDCLALVDWLGRSGHRAELVFGVAAYPFAAHCWVQAGGRVLDDHPESPSRFAPILHFQ